MTVAATRVRKATLVAIISLLTAGTAWAQDVADFYRGRLSVWSWDSIPGGGADTYARLIARYLGRHVPGNPAVVVRHMQGAGSVIAANYVFNVSPKDGWKSGCSPATSSSIR